MTNFDALGGPGPFLRPPFQRSEIEQEIDLEAHRARLDEQSAELKRQADLLQDLKVDTPVPSTATGSQRRLKIEVPSPGGGGTRLGMGYRWAGMNYDGFGVDTVGHVVMNARGAGSTMALQAKGQILIQSEEDSLYLVSKSPAILASADATNVVGGAGVLLAGGFPADPVNPTVAGALPGDPTATKDHAAWMSTIGSFWSMVDAGVASMSVARAAMELKTNPSSLSPASAAGILFNAANAINNTLGLAGSGIGGVTIHGKGGLTMGTTGTCGIYAALGLTMGSTYAGLIGTVEAELLGQTAKVNALGDVSVLGGKEATLASKSGPTEIACRHGDLNLFAGAEVKVGCLSKHGVQDVTRAVRVSGSERVIVQTKEKSAWADRVGIHAWSHDEMSHRSDKKLAIQSENANVEVLAKKGIVLKSEERVRLDIDEKLNLEVNKQQKNIQLRADEARALLCPSVVRLGFPGQGFEITKKGVFRVKGGKKLQIF